MPDEFINKYESKIIDVINDFKVHDVNNGASFQVNYFTHFNKYDSTGKVIDHVAYW